MPSLASLPADARLIWLLGLVLALALMGASLRMYFAELATGWRLLREGRRAPTAFPLRRVAVLTCAPLYWSELLRLRWPGELGGPTVWMVAKAGDYTQLAWLALAAAALPVALHYTLWAHAHGYLRSKRGQDNGWGDASGRRDARPSAHPDADLEARFRQHMAGGPGGAPGAIHRRTPRGTAADADLEARFRQHMAGGPGGAPGAIHRRTPRASRTDADLEARFMRHMAGSVAPREVSPEALAAQFNVPRGPEIPVDPETGLLADPPPAPALPDRRPKLGPVVVGDGFGPLSTAAPFVGALALWTLSSFMPGLTLGAVAALGYGAWATLRQPR